MQKIIHPVLWVLGIALLFSCSKLGNIEIEDGQQTWALPLLSADLGMEDILENFEDQSFFDTTESGLILLRYEGNLLTRTSQDIFESIETSLNNLPIFVDSTDFQIPFTTPDGMAIDYLELKTGTIQWGFFNEHDDALSVTIRFPELYDENGEFYEIQTAAFAGSPLPTTGLIELAGKYLDADEAGNVNVQYEAIRASTGEPDTLSNFILIINDLTFTYAEGNFENQRHEGILDTIEIDFFENWKGGEVLFSEPRINVTVDNSFGVPTRSEVEIFNVFPFDGETIALEGPPITDGIDFDYPSLEEVGQTKITEFTFDKTNSNIGEIIGSNPIAVEYLIDAITNAGSNTGVRGFISDNSSYSVNVNVELPMYGTAKDFVSVDSFDLDLDIGEDIQEAELKLHYENGLGLELKMNLLFLDAQGDELGRLFPEESYIIPSASVDENGEITDVSIGDSYIPINGDQIELLDESDQCLLELYFSTSDEGSTPVKVYVDQNIKLDLGIKVIR